MIRAALLAALALTLAAAPAAAGQISGPSALALAGLVAERDPALNAGDRAVVARLFAGDENTRPGAASSSPPTRSSAASATLRSPRGPAS